MFQQLHQLKISKTYCYEPGKTSPLPPIPTAETDKVPKDDDESKADIENKMHNNSFDETRGKLENLNEFKESPDLGKRSSVNITEKKLLHEAIEEEKSKSGYSNGTELKTEGLYKLKYINLTTLLTFQDTILTDPAKRDDTERINDKMILLSDGYGER